MIPPRYFRVCDRCGNVTSIESGDASAFLCVDCGSDAAWEFTTQSKAMQHSFDIQYGRAKRVAS